jgi:hypothetical protein
MTYTPGGQVVKTPRACPKLWRTANGNFLFWFHDHGGKTYRGRNPAWILGGREKEGKIHWSQPELLLYGPVSKAEMSYPDLIEQDGRYWITETEKKIARVHEVDRRFLEALWRDGDVPAVTQNGLILDVRADEGSVKDVELPRAWDLRELTGLTLDLWVRFDDLSEGQVLLDNRSPDGRGLILSTTGRKTVGVDLNDGSNEISWDCDAGSLRPDTWHHIVMIADAGPGLVRFVVDGVHSDGRSERPVGWSRWRGDLGDVSGQRTLRLAPSLHGKLKRVRVYDRYLRTAETVANYRAGL